MQIKDKILTIYKNESDNLTKGLYKVDGLETLLLTTNDFLYIGYKKPISQLFIELETANTNNSILTIEKYNGAWTEVDGWDETEGFKQSGFILLDSFDNETKTTIASEEMYWIRISLDVNSSSMSVRLINLIFSNLEDLLNDEPDIKKYYPADLDSHIFSFVAAREYILRKINNAGKYKYKESTKEISQINQFDLFDINELREASNYYSLYKIFMNISDASDDIYSTKAQAYFNKFKASYKVFEGSMLSIDLDDSGSESEAEKSASIQTTKLRR